MDTQKTIKVKSKEHDGQVVKINEADFDEKVHERISAKRAKLSDEKEAKAHKKAEKKKLKETSEKVVESQSGHDLNDPKDSKDEK